MIDYRHRPGNGQFGLEANGKFILSDPKQAHSLFGAGAHVMLQPRKLNPAVYGGMGLRVTRVSGEDEDAAEEASRSDDDFVPATGTHLGAYVSVGVDLVFWGHNAVYLQGDYSFHFVSTTELEDRPEVWTIGLGFNHSF
jgi:hypothetical protein